MISIKHISIIIINVLIVAGMLNIGILRIIIIIAMHLIIVLTFRFATLNISNIDPANDVCAMLVAGNDGVIVILVLLA